MAANYEILTSESVYESTGPTTGHDVEQISARAIPSGVMFTVRVPPILMDAENVSALCEAQADFYNTVSAWPNVDSVAEFQDFGANDEIRDHLTVTVTSSDGRLKQTIESQTFKLGMPQLREEIEQVAAKLDRVGAL